ncbi:30S ribosomal protein S1 [Desulforhopalus singaporensis]|uniref:SSU ribosomal protein S1P n=1 Tax=Desulforhopalus singaporensis TaxID=91360 RepID=A0A1H0TG82_9BACT|nr:30S ribosomal protein S1 [Desulforhopalus singaporensis]SDP52984.1 SSU ribosomal protein S1P [Desulforhopalus singaporensis]
MTEANSDSFEDLFKAQQTRKIRHLTPGQKIKATIVGITEETTFLDVGGKSEGVLNSSELKDGEGNISYQLGDVLDVYFLQAKASEQLFTMRIGSGSSTAHLEEAFRSSIPVEGFVKAEIKGGFEITLGGNVRSFCPYSQMGIRRVEDSGKEYLETHMQFLITRFEENGRNIVVSARALQEALREEMREKLRNTLEEGQTIDGTVSSIRDFGAFVDIGGVDGLIPISEIGWSRVQNVAEHFTVGQQVKAVIKKLDWDNNRISLSYKETQEDPWEKAAASFAEGSTHTGTVARLAQFGAFVTLAPGIDGLIHISKLGAGRRINHPREVLEEGQDIDVKIESFDLADKRIGLVPADYVSQESEQEQEQKEYRKFIAKNNGAKEKKTVGSLGALLQEKLAKKKK